jgi:hypothetical protein
MSGLSEQKNGRHVLELLFATCRGNEALLAYFFEARHSDGGMMPPLLSRT